MMRALSLLFAALALAHAPALAGNETRVGEEGFQSPAATLEQMDWLVGQWIGEGIGGAPSMESWLPPTGGTMVGTFVQQSAEGEIQFTEHLYLMEEEGTLVLRLKHFDANLVSWEEKEDMLTFRLVAIEPCAAYFHALTLRCADADKPGEGLVAAVRMKSDKPEVQELVFRFGRAARFNGSSECDGTTFAINQCLGAISDRAKLRQNRYLEAALGSAANDSALAEQIRESDSAFNLYRDRECTSVYEQWKDGSIRNAMTLRCLIRLTDQRTHDIWRNWLTYQDSSEPILPEPEPTL